MGYHICHVISIEQTVDVHTVTSIYDRLRKLFLFLDPSIRGTAIMGRIHAIRVIDNGLTVLADTPI